MKIFLQTKIRRQILRIAAVESKLGKTLEEIEMSAIRSRTIRKLT